MLFYFVFHFLRNYNDVYVMYCLPVGCNNKKNKLRKMSLFRCSLWHVDLLRGKQRACIEPMVMSHMTCSSCNVGVYHQQITSLKWLCLCLRYSTYREPALPRFQGQYRYHVITKNKLKNTTAMQACEFERKKKYLIISSPKWNNLRFWREIPHVLIALN